MQSRDFAEERRQARSVNLVAPVRKIGSNLGFNEFTASLGGGNRFVEGVPGVGDVRRGETGDEVKDRVSGLLFNIASDQTFHGKTILCFTHWFPIAQALRISGVAVENLGAYKIPNGGCCSFIIKGNEVITPHK